MRENIGEKRAYMQLHRSLFAGSLVLLCQTELRKVHPVPHA